jgi:class 3 adenylate cyclase/predicted metal-dependent HD superfamily phosphohydrolase
MERFLNILVVDANVKNQAGLKTVLSGGGNNVQVVATIEESKAIIQKKEIGIFILNIDDDFSASQQFIAQIKQEFQHRVKYILVMSSEIDSGSKLVKSIHQGAIDFIQMPLNPNLVKVKVDMYKTLYYKDLRINQLLNNIFPSTVLDDLYTKNGFMPRRIEKGVVLFTDFVDFSTKSKSIKPIRLLKKLDYYFTQFDAIMERYKLEKIKTIGDAYMALAGVTEENPEPAIRACLAAIEIRNFMLNEQYVANAFKKDFWEIRIGIHQGPLVAGIIGDSKKSFDVWGDTVNIAARAEQGASPGLIEVSKNIYQEVHPYFNLSSKGKIEIKKRGGQIEMFTLDRIQQAWCLYGEGKYASVDLRVKCGLPSVDFDHMRKDILNRLKSLLPAEIVYHDLSHTLNVEKAVVRYAKLEGIAEEEITLLQTAALYHDVGFIFCYDANESFAIKLATSNLPRFGYNKQQIAIVCKMIAATQINTQPTTQLEKLMVDADHDYLGRADYYIIASRLRKELAHFGREMDDETWIEFQLKYLSTIHRYHTETATNIRLQSKKTRIHELQLQLENCKKNENLH